MPGRPPIRYPRPRPINPQDNPLTTGLASNPNGTYVANPFPTTSAIGGTGGYGAMLPTVQVNTLPYQVNPFSQAVRSTFSRPEGAYPGYGQLPPIEIPTGNRTPYPLYAQGVQAIQEARQRAQEAANYRPTFSAQSAVPGYVPADQQTTFNPAVNTRGQQARYQDIISRLAAGEDINLTKSDQEQIEKLLTQGAGGSGGQTLGAGDFYGYERNPETGRSERVVKNAATGGDFLKELRWDPQRKKYVQIGKLMREGKLDKYGKWHKYGKRKGGRGGRKNPVQAGPAETTSGFTGSYGVVNFNTGTG